MVEVFKLVGRIALDGSVKLEKDLKKIDRQAAVLGRSFEKMGSDLEKVGKSLSKRITLPLSVAFTGIVKFGADFQKTMVQSTAIMGELTNETYKKLEMAARDTAKVTRFSAVEAGQALEFLALAGFDAEQSIAALPKIAAFAQAGNFNLAVATNLSADAQAALGMKVKDAQKNMENLVRVTDVLTRAGTLANATTQQFSEALTEKAAVALRNLNKDIEEGVAVLAVFADQGVKGGQAGTVLNATLEGMSRQAIKNRETFEALGIHVFNADGSMRNLADITVDLEKAFGGLSTEQKRTALMQLGFNRQALNGLQLMMGNSTAIRKFEQELRNAGGTTQRVADKQINNFWDQLKLVKNQLIDVVFLLWEELEPALMNTVIPALNKGIDTLRGLTEWFKNLNPGMKETVGLLLGLAASYGPVLLGASGLAKMIGVLIPLFTKLRLGQLSLNAAMKANPIGVVVTAIYLLITAGILLWKNWDKISTFLAESWDFIVHSTQQAVSYLKILIFSYVKHFVDNINIIAKYIPGLNNMVASAQEKLNELITTEKEGIQYRRESRKEMKEQAKAMKEAEKAAKELKDQTDALNETHQEEIDVNQELVDSFEDISLERSQFEEEWTRKLFEQTALRLQLLEKEYETSIKEANRLNADKTAIEEYYKNERKKIYEEEAETKAEFERNWTKQLKEQQLERTEDEEERLRIRLEILQMEREEAIKAAEKENHDIALIIDYYEKEELRIIEEHNKTKQEAREEYEKEWNKKYLEILDDRMTLLEMEEKEALEKADKLGAAEVEILTYYERKKKEIRRQTAQDYLSTMSDMLGRVESIFGQHFQNREQELKNWYDAEKEKIEASQISEEEKQLALEELEKQREAREREMARRQAEADKAFAIFSIIINTSRAAIEALPNLALSAVVTAMGVGQMALVAAQPLPALAKGGYAVGETLAIVGDSPVRESGELILPMRTGVEILAENLFQKLNRLTGPRSPYAMGQNMGSSYNGRKEVHFHIGTLIADRTGLKMLERKLAEIRLAENRRKGVNNETW